jgi:hypothetical protein
MSPEELKVYQTHGIMRLVSSWTNHYLHFPYPPWSEIPAPDIVSPQRFQASLLNKVPRLHASGSFITQVGKDIVLRLYSEVRADMAQKLMTLPPTQPVALLPNFDPQADASLAWQPEQNQTVMNVTPQSAMARVAGCFLLVLPEQATLTTRQVEDGFSLLLPSDTWVKLREALAAGQPLTLPTPAKQFRLEFI